MHSVAARGPKRRLHSSRLHGGRLQSENRVDAAGEIDEFGPRPYSSVLPPILLW
jgi:hypothetical protein